MNQQQFVLVVTYGRSGSTLLQGVLNSFDEIFVAGENNNFLYGQYLSYLSLEEAICRDPLGDESVPAHPWFARNQLNLENFLKMSAELAKLSIFPARYEEQNHRYLGFKEIRYLDLLLHGKSIEHLDGYVNFLATIFHPCKIVTLARPHSQVIKSSWWEYYEDKTALVKALHNIETWMINRRNENSLERFHLDYRDLTLNNPALTKLASFLELEPNASALESTLAKQHSLN